MEGPFNGHCEQKNGINLLFISSVNDNSRNFAAQSRRGVAERPVSHSHESEINTAVLLMPSVSSLKVRVRSQSTKVLTVRRLCSRTKSPRTMFQQKNGSRVEKEWKFARKGG